MEDSKNINQIKYFKDMLRQSDDEIIKLESELKRELKNNLDKTTSINILLKENKDKDYLILEFETIINNLKNELTSLQEENKKNRKKWFQKTKCDLSNPLLVKNDDNLINELSTSNINLEKTYAKLEKDYQKLNTDYLNLCKLKEIKIQKELSFEDELYIINKKNHLTSVKDEIDDAIKKKDELNRQIFELKSIIKILEQEINKKNQLQEEIKLKKCCHIQ